MKAMKLGAGIAALLSVHAVAHAQTAFVCPALPADTGLTWEHRPAGGSEFCRALRADGSEVFAVFVTDKAPFKPSRNDRAETGTIDGSRNFAGA